MTPNAKAFLAWFQSAGPVNMGVLELGLVRPGNSALSQGLASVEGCAIGTPLGLTQEC